jgi:hypothetical protein
MEQIYELVSILSQNKNIKKITSKKILTKEQT